MFKLVVEVDADTRAALAVSADQHQTSIEKVASEALSMFVQGTDRLLDRARWSPEDLAAINEGFAQLDRGEGVSQEVVEREIDELLRS